MRYIKVKLKELKIIFINRKYKKEKWATKNKEQKGDELSVIEKFMKLHI